MSNSGFDMSLRIKDNELYDNSGKWLKTIACSKKVRLEELEVQSSDSFLCHFCEHTVYNSDVMTEDQIVRLLNEKPNTCLSINLKNPIFESLD
jgi:hypothetical protein